MKQLVPIHTVNEFGMPDNDLVPMTNYTIDAIQNTLTNDFLLQEISAHTMYDERVLEDTRIYIKNTLKGKYLLATYYHELVHAIGLLNKKYMPNDIRFEELIAYSGEYMLMRELWKKEINLHFLDSMLQKQPKAYKYKKYVREAGRRVELLKQGGYV